LVDGEIKGYRFFVPGYLLMNIQNKKAIEYTEYRSE